MLTEYTLLLEQLHHAGENSIWCADEQVQELLGSHFAGWTLTNRFHQPLPARTIFCDFDFSQLPCKQPQQVIFRIAKEKAINLHIIEQALQYLPAQGRLMLIGYKNEGINSLKSQLEKEADCQIAASKLGKQLQLLEITSNGPQQLQLSKEDYTQLQPLQQGEFNFISKPGLFGWKKVDRGSEILIETLQQQAEIQTFRHVLDLGCGYGYLSMQAWQLGFQHIDATDNCAAALIACRANFAALGINGQVLASDCAEQLQQNYDLILCNPPFHQGFDHRQGLTQRFVEQAAAHLRPGGEAYFVTNQFIGIEKLFIKHFTKQQLLVKKEGFKVIHLRR